MLFALKYISSIYFSGIVTHMYAYISVGYSSWFDHVRSWEKAREANEKFPILFVHYEDLKKVLGPKPLVWFRAVIYTSCCIYIWNKNIVVYICSCIVIQSTIYK